MNVVERVSAGSYLIMLRRELARQGVTCELRDRGGQMGLRVSWPGAAPAVVVPLGVVSLAFIDGEWLCCWPQARVICAITPLDRAAGVIISELGLGGNDRAARNVAGRELLTRSWRT